MTVVVLAYEDFYQIFKDSVGTLVKERMSGSVRKVKSPMRMGQLKKKKRKQLEKKKVNGNLKCWRAMWETKKKTQGRKIKV